MDRFDRIGTRLAVIGGVAFFAMWATFGVMHAFDTPEHWDASKALFLRFMVVSLIAFLSIVVALIARWMWNSTK